MKHPYSFHPRGMSAVEREELSQHGEKLRQEQCQKPIQDSKPSSPKLQEKVIAKKAAGAILANATRKSSSKAKKANPKLKKVRGK